MSSGHLSISHWTKHIVEYAVTYNYFIFFLVDVLYIFK